MIPGHRLSEWANDPDHYRASEGEIHAFAAEWNAGPSNRQIAETMARVAVRDAAQVTEAVCGLFEKDVWVSGLIETLAEKMRRDPFFVPPFRHINSDVHQGLIVYEDDLVSIAVGVSGAGQLAAKKSVPRGATSISFSGQMSVLKFVASGAARISFWEAPKIGPNFSRATAGICRKI
ncbi:MAG: hypothetical protein ACXW2T_03320, partial [Allosphingosinicella sp.]